MLINLSTQRATKVVMTCASMFFFVFFKQASQLFVTHSTADYFKSQHSTPVQYTPIKLFSIANFFTRSKRNSPKKLPSQFQQIFQQHVRDVLIENICNRISAWLWRIPSFPRSGRKSNCSPLSRELDVNFIELCLQNKVQYQGPNVIQRKKKE